MRPRSYNFIFLLLFLHLHLFQFTWTILANDRLQNSVNPVNSENPLLRKKNLCPHIIAVGSENISLAAMEKKMVCGDPHVEEWREIPLPQAEFHLKAILQTRGYHHSRFVISEDQDKKLFIYLGHKTYVREIKITEEWNSLLKPYHQVVGKLLTPELLDEIQNYLKKELGNRGYPCSPFSLEADADTGIIVVKIEKIHLAKILGANQEAVTELDPHVLDRYQAFSIGQTFNNQLLELTTRRTVEEGIVQSSRFALHCQDDGVTLQQYLVLGKPRLFTIGVGANTERLGLVKISWKNVRMGRKGNSLHLNLLASLKSQEFEAAGYWYPLTPPSRVSVRPSLEIKREEERQYILFSNKLRGEVIKTHDFEKSSLYLRVGPVLNDQLTIRGTGPHRTDFLSFNLGATWTHHGFEYYRTSPREGFTLDGGLTTTYEGVLSPLSATLLTISGEQLWNLGDFTPPILIIGLRGKFSTTLTSHSFKSFEKLPLMFRHFLGGVDDMRGFRRKQIPNDPYGAMTTLYLGGEIRTASLFSERLQPLAFIDTGWPGKESFRLERTLYWSPGVGLRFESPIGSFRGILAHGLIENGDPHERQKLAQWQFYLSYGQEF